MRERRALYFASAVLAVAAAGAVASGLAMSDSGVTFPDGTMQVSADTRRAFYLTNNTHLGGGAPGACAAGFHMASIWEVIEVSTLRYATDTEGSGDVFRRGDMGAGPPSNVSGWARTGADDSSTNTEGLGNCNDWDFSSSGVWGTAIFLYPVWNVATGAGTPSQIIAPWDSTTFQCNTAKPVWCVQD